MCQSAVTSQLSLLQLATLQPEQAEALPQQDILPSKMWSLQRQGLITVFCPVSVSTEHQAEASNGRAPGRPTLPKSCKSNPKGCMAMNV